jgi:hypothetical protein
MNREDVELQYIITFFGGIFGGIFVAFVITMIPKISELINFLIDIFPFPPELGSFFGLTFLILFFILSFISIIFIGVVTFLVGREIIIYYLVRKGVIKIK